MDSIPLALIQSILASPYSIEILLILALIGGMRRWWVFGWQLDDARKQIEQMRSERDQFKDLALNGTALADKAVDRIANIIALVERERK